MSRGRVSWLWRISSDDSSAPPWCQRPPALDAPCLPLLLCDFGLAGARRGRPRRLLPDDFLPLLRGLVVRLRRGFLVRFFAGFLTGFLTVVLGLPAVGADATGPVTGVTGL
jgi:hypothetical protein